MNPTRRTIAASGLALAFAAGLGWPNQADAQQVRKLTYATYVPDTFAMSKADIWFMDEVTKRTNGRIVFERYFSGSLLKASDILPGIAAGAADIGNSVPSAYNRADYPLSNITLPFLTDRVDSVTFAFKDIYEKNPQFRKEYEGRGLRLLYAPAYGENTIWSSRRIAAPADVKGLRVRAVLAVGDALAKLGASTVAIPWGEAVEGMRRGVVDAMSSAPFDTAVGSGLHEIAKFGSDAGRMGVYAVSTMVINQRTWNSFDQDTQKIFEDVAAQVPQQYFKLLDELLDQAAKRVAERVRGGQLSIDFFSEADAKRLRTDIGGEINREWIATAKKQGVDGQAILDEFVGLVRQYDAKSTYTPGFERVRKLTQ
jgi:TRAP-type transport system periplasmic protein